MEQQEQIQKEHRRIIVEAWQRGAMFTGVGMGVALIAMVIMNFQLVGLVTIQALQQCPVEMI